MFLLLFPFLLKSLFTEVILDSSYNYHANNKYNRTRTCTPLVLIVPDKNCLEERVSESERFELSSA